MRLEENQGEKNQWSQEEKCWRKRIGWSAMPNACEIKTKKECQGVYKMRSKMGKNGGQDSERIIELTG